MTLHPTLQDLFERWERNEVVWALLRAPLCPARPEGDIDVLLEKRTAWSAERVAHTAGFITIPGRRHDLHLAQFDRDTGQWLWLHCTTELAFGPFRTLRPGFENRWLASRRTIDGLSVLDPADEFWITLMHALVDKGRLSDRSRFRLGATVGAAAAEGPLAESFGVLLPASWTPELAMEAVRSGQWDALGRLAPGVQAAARSRRPGVVRRAVERARDLAGALKNLRHRRGVSVALLGPDGAGKSTLAAGLEECFAFPVRRLYMGLTGGRLRTVDKLRVPGVVRVLRLAVIWSRYLVGLYHTHRGRLVVYDRYIFDAEVPTPWPLRWWERWARWLDGRACPGPDLVLILDAPGSVMHERKREYTAGTLEEWRQHFLALRARYPNIEVLDTTRSPELVRAAAVDRIWRCYATRWRRR